MLRPFAILGAVVLAASVLAAAQGTITVTAPASGSKVTVPFDVHFTYSATATYTKLWIDGVAIIAEHNGSTFDYTVTALAAGSHTLSLQADDASSNTIIAAHVPITVSSTPPAITVSLSPASASVLSGGTQQFTATVQNTSNTGVTWTVDGSSSGSPTSGTITASGLYTAGTSTGNHSVVATSLADPTKSAAAVVTITASASGPCTPTSAPPSVTFCGPVAGSTVTSTVNVQAAAASTTALKNFLLYLDNVLVYEVPNTASINTNLTMAAGIHHLTAQFYTGTAWVKQSETFTVSSAPPPVSVGITPGTASILPNATQQFTANVQNTSNTGVTWTVDGILGGSSTVGTITGMATTVTYTAPATTAPHTVTVTSLADTTQSASAVVNVTLTPSTFPSSNHVFVIIEENQSFSQVFPSGSATNCTSAGMPYLCGLAAANGLALNFYANVHGSMLDYLYATSGSTWSGSPYNCNGGGCASIGVITGDNLVRALTTAGKTWRGYFEDMPSQGYLGGDTANYLLHHNPFPWYSDVANSVSQQDNMYPFTQFAKDVQANTLQNFNLIIPNGIHDADEPFTTSPSVLLATADTWLNTNISPLLSTPPFQTGGDGILMIVFDEADEAGESGDPTSDDSCTPTQSTGCGGHIAFVMIGPNVTPASTTANTYQFQDMLHTMIHLLGVTDYMNGASGGTDVALLPGT